VQKIKSYFTKFIAAGGIATGVQYVVFWICIYLIGIDTTTASAVGYLFGSIVSYFINYYFTFNSQRPHSDTLPLFYIMVTIGFFVNTGSLHALNTGLGWNPWLSQVCASGLALIWNFYVSKLFVFGWRRR
jgi:putative flippase GtrA